MKYLIFTLGLVCSTAFGQTMPNYVKDSLNCADTCISTTYGVFYTPESAYQTLVTLLSGETADTIKVQQRIGYGHFPTTYIWVTLPLYNSLTTAVDTLIITRPVSGTGKTYAQFLIWSPFVGDRWRFVRNSPAGYKPAIVWYYDIANRFWANR